VAVEITLGRDHAMKMIIFAMAFAFAGCSRPVTPAHPEGLGQTGMTKAEAKHWPPDNPFYPIDGVVIREVLLDTSDHDEFHGDGTTLKVYRVSVTHGVNALLANNRIRHSRIWVARPFDEKTMEALEFLSKWTTTTKVAPFMRQMLSSDDLYVAYDTLQRDTDLKRVTDAALWLFAPSQNLLVFIQVNT